MPTKPLIITCAIVGAELTRDIYPHPPLAPAELVTAAVEAVAAGTSIIHLHVRDEEGKLTQRVEVFREVSEQVRRGCDCILQYSTGGEGGYTSRRAPPLPPSQTGDGHPVHGHDEFRRGDLRKQRTDHRDHRRSHPGPKISCPNWRSLITACSTPWSAYWPEACPRSAFISTLCWAFPAAWPPPPITSSCLASDSGPARPGPSAPWAATSSP